MSQSDPPHRATFCHLQATPELGTARRTEPVRPFHFLTEAFMANRKAGIQGEGDKEADKRYRERTEKFVNSPEGKEKISHAGDLSEEEARRLRKVEEKTKQRAKEEDPQIRHQSKN
jgi:hypothetical protein